MKFFTTALVYVLTLGAMLVGFAGMWFVYAFKGVGPLSEPTLITIAPGSGLSTIARDLENIQAIEYNDVFKIGVKLSGADTALQAGEYELQPGMSMEEIMMVLRDGKTFQRQITIPEGMTSYEIVQLLNKADDLTEEPAAIPPEGSLLPETYSYSNGEDRNAILSRMMREMKKMYLPPPEGVCTARKGMEDSPLRGKGCWPEPLKNWNDVITLASIVEKETAVASERKRVAGVFINRLRIGMALQTDPTVIYAITKGQHDNNGKGPLGRRLLKKDLEFDSPYNTYKYPGLPPGPIANPGQASIEAVLDPEDHDYLYFVANGTGGHAFGKTLEEHNANVAKWRKIRRAQN